jgi:hypothetical protein
VPPAFEEGDGTEIGERLDWARERLGFEAVVAGNRYDEVRAANEGGSFFVVHGAMTLGADHPLSYILGDNTPLGDKARVPFAKEAAPLLARLSLLFDGLDARGVASHIHAGLRRCCRL